MKKVLFGFLALSVLGSPVFSQTVGAPPPTAPAAPSAQQPPQAPPNEDVIGNLEQDDTTIDVPPLTTPADANTPAGQTAELGRKVAAIIANDLAGSGLFKPTGPDGMRTITMPEVLAPNFGSWRSENLIHGYVRANGDGTLSVGCYLYDVSLKEQQNALAFVVPPRDWRKAAHKCADGIYSKLSGESPFFDSRIVYVAETGPKNRRVKRIAVMDSDGANHRFLTNGQNIVLTPRYSPDYKRLLYLSYSDRRPRIYVLDIASGRQQLVVQGTNQTFSPRWAPDGKSILYSMENAGNTDIYRVPAQANATPVKLTSGPGINVGGSFSPDGSRIVFESDRSGTQQIYIMNADGSNVQRITFGEGQYATPEWSPRGDLIAFTKIGGGFRVGIMTPSGTGERLLTNSWQDEAPTWSPNGRVIQFFRTNQGTGRTSVWQVDITGAKLRRIETPTDGSDPSWGAIQD